MNRVELTVVTTIAGTSILILIVPLALASEDKLLQKTPTTFIIKRAVDVLSFLTQQDHKPSNSQSSIWKYCVIMSIATHGARHGDEKTHVGTCIT